MNHSKKVLLKVLGARLGWSAVVLLGAMSAAIPAFAQQKTGPGTARR